MRRTYGLPATLLWAVLSAVVFLGVDGLATRPVEIHAEELRSWNDSDEQVLMHAVQRAREVRDNWWWIRDSRPVIVLDSMREYRIDPALYRFFSVPVVKRTPTGELLVVHAVPSTS